MKKKTITTLIACLLCGGMALGQEASSYAPTVPDRIPPSPTSRVFQKFTDYPVSHATGTIDIQIPLYTLEAGELSIPFALKYHSSGVRVQDPVGVVGRNWAFFPGFKISRTIMSKPDEIYPVTDIGNNPTIENELCIASPYNDSGDNCDCWNEVSGHGVLPRIDGQYDIFQVNMAELSCSFILQRVNGVDVVKQITESPLKITPLLDSNTNFYQNRLYGFEILDDKGNKYVFGESSPVHSTSQTLGFIERNENNLYFCGWMLREVVLADGNKMNFTYQQVTEYVPLYNNCITVLDNGKLKEACHTDDMINTATGSTSRFWRFLGDAGYKQNTGNTPPYMYSDKSLVPLTISFPSGSANFTYVSNRLTGMSVKRTNGTTLKTVSLTYLTPDTGALLKTVTVSGEGNYRMTYKNEGEIANRGFDWWGFYNGQPTHNTNLPNLSLPVHATWGAYGTIVSNDFDLTIGDNANRTPNSLYMDTHSLIEMVYPTRGKLSVTYEPHSYTVLGAAKTGGGIRVKSASLYDPVSEKTMTRNYTYADAHYLGYSYPDAKMLVTNRYMCPLDAGYCTFRVRTYSVFPHNPYMRGNLNCVWYGKITETSELWKKEYRYAMSPDEYENYYTDATVSSVNEPECLLSQMNSLLYSSPTLLKEDSYRKESSGYTKVQSVSHTYNSYQYNIKGTIGMPYLKIVDGYSNCQFLEPLRCDDNYITPYGSPIKRYTYYIRAGVVRPGTTRKVDYHGTDSIVETVTMAYDDARKYNAVSKTVAKSDGTQEVERYYYSNHTAPSKSSLTSAQQTAIGTLTTNNRLTTVVQQETLKGTSSLYSVLNGFDSSSRLQTEYYRKGSGTMGSRMEYKVYDSYRNPVHAVKDGTEHVVYIWGYKGQRLVAAIKGATYDAVKNALGGSTPESLSSATSPNMTLIDGLRSKLSGATVTTFTHDPLVGPLTKRDANGNLTTYEYDSDGRLYRVKDHNGKVKDRYLYHYRP